MPDVVGASCDFEKLNVRITEEKLERATGIEPGLERVRLLRRMHQH